MRHKHSKLIHEITFQDSSSVILFYSVNSLYHSDVLIGRVTMVTSHLNIKHLDEGKSQGRIQDC